MKAVQVGVGLLLVAAVPGLSGATGVVQQPPGPPTTAAAEITQCAQAQMVVDQLLAAAMLRLDSARQSNAAADLRAAVDNLQNTLRDVRAQLAPCAGAQATADPHAGHSLNPTATPAAKPSAPAPMDHSKMPMGAAPVAKPAPAKGGKPDAPATPMDHSKMPKGAPAQAASQAIDPVCGLNVDPLAAPQATHQGQTHHFCSEQHRQLFQRNPLKYLPKGK